MTAPTPPCPSAPEFVDCTTDSSSKRHVSEKPTAQWGLRTLCGHTARRNPSVGFLHELPACKQCEKSRQRRIAGRPS